MTYYCDRYRHLVCVPYSKDNLHKMAEDLGIPRHFYEDHGHPHYDIPVEMIEEVMAKCTVVRPRQIMAIINIGMQGK